MTLIVGILCDGGVAIAADRQVTSTAFIPLANPNATVQTSVSAVTKVTQIGSDTLLGVAGMPPIGAQFEIAIKKHQGQFATRSYEFAIKNLAEEIPKLVRTHLDTAASAARFIPKEIAYGQAVCECLLAANFKDGHRLIQITQHGLFDVATPALLLRAIGSGQAHADPFLLYLKNTFWPNRLPTVEEGITAAVWTIDYAIEVGAPLVGRDINAYSLERDAKRMKARQLTPEEIKEHRAFVQVARDKLRELSGTSQATPAATPIPTPEGA